MTVTPPLKSYLILFVCDELLSVIDMWSSVWCIKSCFDLLCQSILSKDKGLRQNLAKRWKTSSSVVVLNIWGVDSCKPQRALWFSWVTEELFVQPFKASQQYEAYKCLIISL